MGYQSIVEQSYLYRFITLQPRPSEWGRSQAGAFDGRCYWHSYRKWTKLHISIYKAYHDAFETVYQYQPASCFQIRQQLPLFGCPENDRAPAASHELRLHSIERPRKDVARLEAIVKNVRRLLHRQFTVGLLRFIPVGARWCSAALRGEKLQAHRVQMISRHFSDSVAIRLQVPLVVHHSRHLN
ncbi:hypothetical protein CRM22_005602 [Opisthorchis felineus]|uniref:Uncharacterized protein n=1 Tax=Opisthorchis felineus TaxID=147828 RepID=A0A4S2LRR7_OPIFE|nr:hypothetical protein CRM22_005602 [Opisthorchis felineus]